MVNDIQGLRGPSVGLGGSNKVEKPGVTPPPPAPDLNEDAEIIDMVGPPLEKPAEAKKSKPGLRDSFAKLKTWWTERSKKEKIIIAIAAVVVAALLGLGGFLLIHRSKPAKPAVPPVVKQEVKAPPKPTTERSHLTGVLVPPEYNLLPVTGIMIENSPDARPQSGLNQAGVVFEAIAEGGITRFLTLWQEAQPEYVGPVRSARPYYLSWLQGFDAAIAHVGGSPDALNKIKADGIKDLDQFANGGAYQRIAQRYAPHNVYTNVPGLIVTGRTKGYNSSTFTSFPRKDDKPITASRPANTIDLSISSALYNVHYTYDPGSNSYRRNQAGTPHVDERSGQQISPKVVIALVMQQGIDADGQHTTYGTLGSGTAYFFQDGGIAIGTWSKANDKEQYKLLGSNGVEFPLNAGQTWITIVGAATAVTYSP